MSRLLVVDDDIQMLSALEAALRHKGHSVETASNGIDAAAKLETSAAGVQAVITDLKMPGMDGIELLNHVRRTKPGTPVIVLTAFGTVQTAVDAMKAGANDFLVKPFSHQALEDVLNKHVTAGFSPRSSVSGSTEIITQNAAMTALLDQAAQAAKTQATVLVQAESGTGKELLARWIHDNSANQRGPFVAVNCAALPDNLLESELFGYEKGAFTGANGLKPGKFELAQNGTILLDEIGEMAPLLQAKLLRVLQEHEVDRVGGRRPIPIHVRVIATTNKDLRKLIARGQFREDLFFRLNVVPLRIPPLRERKDDIAVLTQHFAKKYGTGNEADVLADAATLDLLERYGWPGNVRELENVVHRAFALRGKLRITPADLFENSVEATETAGLQAGQSVDEMERKLIMTTLEQTSGNRTHAAKLLGISLRTLRNKLREYRVEEAAAL
ncbi:MAG TPA: sigma-54 dependent transcriptional regulator [Terriglobia bacterium]|nr:sigma-54 dependent transcriptional regulator [Terriglobia bacterium]